MRIPRASSISGPKSDKPSFNATSWLNFSDIRAQSKLLEAVAGYNEDVTVLSNQDTSVSVVSPHVTPGLFAMLGRSAMLGRTFTEAEGTSGGPQVVLLSEGLWREKFNADPHIVGQSLKLGNKPYTVVGVMPESFRFPEQLGPDLKKGVWLPAPAHPRDAQGPRVSLLPGGGVLAVRA